MKLSLISLIGVLLSFNAQAVRPFKTDICTGYINGVWSHCCIQHDLLLWAGGTKNQNNQADIDLRECVRETGNDLHARLMYLGLQIGRKSPFKLKGQQWGNAWGDQIRDHKLEEHELQELLDELIYADLPDWMLDDLIIRHSYE